MPQDPDVCDHQNWTVDTAVHRTTLPGGALGAVQVSVKLRCVDCNTPWWFPGLPTGTSYAEPTTSTDGFTVTLPAVRANLRCMPDPELQSVTIRTGDTLKGRKRT